MNITKEDFVTGFLDGYPEFRELINSQLESIPPIVENPLALIRKLIGNPEARYNGERYATVKTRSN